VNSIRRRLLLSQISAVVLTGLLVSTITYGLAWNAFNQLRDYGLEQIAYSILRHGIDTATQYDPDKKEEEEDAGQFVSQIWDAGGTMIYSSLTSGGPPLQNPGLSVLSWQDEEWHIFSLRKGGLIIQVAHTSANRKAMFARIVPWLLLPFSVLVAVLAWLIWMAVGRALKPLEAMHREISERGVLSLHALETRDLPEEIAPVAAALNELLAGLDAALTAQRRFTADAAHELRTPLTALKLQVQLLQRSPEPTEHRLALAQLEAGVDRASHLVEQLLRMARLAPEARHEPFAQVRLDELAKRVVADHSSQAEARNIDLGAGECEAVEVSGQVDSLRVMLSNLVDNAVRYTPLGGRVDVEVRREGNKASITVSDTGPGIPAEERERVFDRFYRLAGADISGNGLGLAIVREVVSLHGGHIRLDDRPGGGLRVSVRLPAR
jgi:two-component system, OmpR family, sensor kinase